VGCRRRGRAREEPELQEVTAEAPERRAAASTPAGKDARARPLYR
jgi:hypothetical protein